LKERDKTLDEPPKNDGLVERIVRLADEFDREIAKPEEAAL
jgi:uncharacterized protein (DUF849 family)